MNRNVFLSLAFVAVFLLIFIIALISRISLSVSFGRAMLAAVVFSVMLWLVMLMVRYSAPPEETEQSPGNLGQNLNIEVTDAAVENQYDAADGNRDTAFSEQEFIPLTGRQVDPNMAKVINQDPEKAAKIVKKMGFDE